jgi:hypothetical protein
MPRYVLVRRLLTAMLTIALATSSAMAETWPTRPVTMVVPFAAGSASDTVGRIIAARLSEVLGQQERLRSAGVTVVATDRRSPDYLKKFLVSEIAQWAGIIKASGVSLD